MLTQRLPSTATEYASAQRLEQQAATAAVLRQWSRMGDDFDSSWARIAPTLTAIVTAAQARVAASSSAYIPAILEATGQTAAVAAVAQANLDAFLGVTGTGATVAETLAIAPIRAKQAMASTIATDDATGAVSLLAGQSQRQALQSGGQWLSAAVGTILSDTGRAVEATEMYVRPVGGYVRMLTPPSCARCVVLAGRWYRKNQGFRRHPDCDCRHIPASEAVGDDIRIDPDDYFDSLDQAGKLKLAGSSANLQAIEGGADLTQIVNAYRKTAGMQFAQVSSIKVDRRGDKFTTEGVTRRGLAGQQQIGLRRFGRSQPRLMPESIYRNADTREDALRQLRLYGWIRDDAAVTRGRAVFADLRRTERNTRARARRAARA